MKFFLFSDYHYSPGEFKNAGVEGIRHFQKLAIEAGCHMIVHAGDLTHGPTAAPELVNAYNDSPLPAYHCLGNHDTDRSSLSDTLRLYNMPDVNYFIEAGGYRFIFVSTNYYKDGDSFVKFQLGNHGAFPRTREWIPGEVVSWLAETVEGSVRPCIVISHASLVRCVDGIRNRDEVLAVINNANRKKKHSVLMCINGHNHTDGIFVRDGVLFFEVNSTLMDWVAEAHDGFSPEECAKYSCMRNTLYYSDPLYAIVTLEGTNVTVEGVESTPYMGLDRRAVNRPICDRDGREIRPCISSARVSL